MKKMYSVLLSIFLFSILSAVVIEVPQGGSIQNAIDIANEEDIIELTGNYYVLTQPLNIANRDCITITSQYGANDPENCIISGNDSSKFFDIVYSYSINIENICFQNGVNTNGTTSDGTIRIISSNAINFNNCIIRNCYCIDGAGSAIYSTNSSLSINGTKIYNNNGANAPIYFVNGDYTEVYFNITHSIFYNNVGVYSGGIYGSSSNHGCTNLEMDHCLFYSNVATVQGISFGAGAVSWYGSGSTGQFTEDFNIYNSTFVDNTSNGYALTINDRGELSWVTLIMKNCILWNNSTSIQIPENLGHTNISYSNIQDGYSGTGTNNINSDPLFEDPGNANDYPATYGYGLTCGSLCIDAGDPTSPFDPDGTVADMGCYYFHHDYDIHRFKKGIRWLSFPILDRDTNGEEDLPTVLSEIAPFIGITDIDVYNESDLNPVVYYDFPSWSRDYGASSEWLYKVDVKPDSERILTVNGDRLPVDNIITGTVPTDQDGYCWLGYWVPYPQSMKDAFGDGADDEDEDFWQYVEKVKSEDWFYSPANNQRGGGMIPVATSPDFLRLEYGKGYMVKFNTAVQDFQWNNSLNISSPVKRTKSVSFPYTEKPDYEAIDFVNIPSSITEIGVYQGDLCVGAVVVDDSIAQVLVYPQETTRNVSYFTFNFIVDRGNNEKVADYCVFNPASGKFEQEFIIPGNQDYSIVSFSNGSNTNDTPFTNNITLSLNYPNPFNPTTTIEYSLSEPVNKIDLSIFNLKGQKINTLYSGSSTSGNFKYIWDGKDLTGNPVSSGIYMYKLESGDTKIIKKMLLMK